jgi:hypothetical protein
MSLRGSSSRRTADRPFRGPAAGNTLAPLVLRRSYRWTMPVPFALRSSAHLQRSDRPAGGRAARQRRAALVGLTALVVLSAAIPASAQTAGDVCQPGQVLQANGQSCLTALPAPLGIAPPGPVANCQPGQVLQPNGQSCLPTGTPPQQVPAGGASTSGPTEPAPNLAVAITTLNVRSAPGLNGRVIGTLQQGAAVAISGCTGGWCALGQQPGWVAQQFLSFSRGTR